MSFFIKSSRKPSWAISRRTLLRGTGACLALPLLDVMRPQEALASGNSPKRILFYYTPNSVIADKHADETDSRALHWFPTQSGSSFQLTHPLESLANYRDDLLILRGLNNGPGLGVAHYTQTAAFLTATHVEMDEIVNAISADQVIAAGLQSPTPFESLHIKTNGSSTSGYNGDGYPQVYSSCVSWKGPGQAVPSMKPRALFDQLFSGSNGFLEQAEINRRKQSVLDFVHADAQALRNQLGSNDRIKLDQYLTSIEEVEARIAAYENWSCDVGPIGADTGDHLTQLELQNDVIAIAFQCDASRVMTAMTQSSGGSHWEAYDWIEDRAGQPLEYKYHHYTHLEDAEGAFVGHQVNRWELAVFAGLLDRLDAIDDGGGQSVLDNTLVVFGKECCGGKDHSTVDMPVVMIDRSQSLGPSGRYVELEPGTPWANLLLTLIQAMGVESDSLGDSTGVLDLS